MSKLGILKQVQLTWMMNAMFNPEACIERDPEIREASFICKIFDKRMEAFGIDLVIPDYLVILIDLCTNANPGQSLMILSEILENIPNISSSLRTEPDL